MTSTTRHATADTSTRAMADTLTEVIDDFLSSLPTLPTLAIDITKESISRTGYLLLLDPTAGNEETYRSLLLAAQAGSTFFKAADVEAEQFSATIRSQIEMESLEPASAGHNVSDWLDSLWTSTICRGQHLVSDLIHLPNETLRAGGSVFDEYMYAWADALRAFFYGDEDLFGRINRSLELTDPEILQNATPEVALYRHYPSMKLLFSLAAGHAEQFNEDLQEAVDLHKRFWTAEDDRSIDPLGYFALAPTALAALAHDKGMPVEVESDYLPKHLVEPTWVSPEQV